MSRPLLIVLADDLTGAGELGAIAHNAGLHTIVQTDLPTSAPEADVLVIDTNTRLLPAAQAAQRVGEFVRQLKTLPHAGFFKKTDSVLRGPVLAELEACAKELGRRRTLLVPSNPSLGRAIRDGRYYISGTPLHRTAFAHDPHHPTNTSDVRTLLGVEKNPAIICHHPSSRLPRTGLIIGEADSHADVNVWAGQADAHTLPAGAADFFRAWLYNRITYQKRDGEYLLPTGAALLLSGTATATDDNHLPTETPLLFKAGRAPSLAAVTRALRETGLAAVAPSKTISRNPRTPAAITRAFCRLAVQLRAAPEFSHLLIAGGATASGVLQALGWSKFEVVHVWGQGVVTLQPIAAPGFAVTVKPGSYAWPNDLAHQLAQLQPCS